jgi:DNA-repair protein XRCC1
MNPAEARANQNPNRVRIFNSDQLSQAVLNQKWDRVKVICTQPFNKVPSATFANVLAF